MKLKHFGALALLLSGCMFCGCKVDDNYNLNNLDTEASFFKGMEFPLGNLRRLTLDELLNLRENAYFFADDQGDYRIHVPFDSFSFDVDLPLNQNLLPESGTVYAVDKLPDFLTDPGQSLHVELAGVEISMRIDSGLPVAATISTGVDLLRSGSVTHHYGVDGLEIVPGLNRFAFNETGKGSLEGAQYQSLPGLDSFFSPVPDQLVINDFQVQIPESGSPGRYPVSCTITADSPVAFSASSACTVSIPVDNAEVNLDQIGLKKAVLTMDVYNSVPLEFSLAATALDGQGGLLEGITAKTDVPIAAGTVDSPAHTLVHVTLTADDLRFKGILLQLHAASNERVAGVHLNRNQGLELKNLVISLPEGIVIKSN